MSKKDERLASTGAGKPGGKNIFDRVFRKTKREKEKQRATRALKDAEKRKN